MKKSLLFVVAMAFACFGVSNAAILVTATNEEQPANDTLMFALPENPEITQEIWTAYDRVNPVTGQHESWRCMKFQPEYLVTALDFTKGDTEKGTANLPANAKVIGLGLNGFDIGSQMTSRGIFHEVTAWCRNIPRDKMSLDFLDLFDGYNTHLPQGDLFTDTVTYRGYYNRPGVICTFDPEATAENPCSIVEVPFGNPDDPRMPFWYKGENIYLTLWMCNWMDVVMKYKYMAYDDAEARYASLMRSGNICFNSETQNLLLNYTGISLMYELPEYRLPAFRTPYYTNDVRVECIGYETEFQLRDEDGNVMERNEDGNYYSLDHTKTYYIFCGNNHIGYTEKGQFVFEDIYKDVKVVINNLTAVEEINSTKTVSNVAYYNLAGQQSAEPVNGVNIVVTTYSDGSTTTAKVIK